MTLRSPIGRARGLGAAKSGLGHHWATIVTAVGLVPLSLWFVVSVIHLAGGDYAAIKGWLGTSCNAALMALTVVLVCYHASLGLQMVIEDYVHSKAKKFAALLATKLIAALLAASMVVSILKVAIGG